METARLLWAIEAFVALAAVWLALNGTTAWGLGLAIAVLGAAVGAVLAPGRPSAWRPWPMLVFGAYFLRESVAGGIDVARRALDPRLPVAPHFVDVPLRLPEGPPRTLMASVVSLVPGTLSADLDAARGVLRVHVLAAGGEARLEALQARIAALFGLEIAP